MEDTMHDDSGPYDPPIVATAPRPPLFERINWLIAQGVGASIGFPESLTQDEFDLFNDWLNLVKRKLRLRIVAAAEPKPTPTE
jgi:hypothetical protein